MRACMTCSSSSALKPSMRRMLRVKRHASSKDMNTLASNAVKGVSTQLSSLPQIK